MNLADSSAKVRERGGKSDPLEPLWTTGSDGASLNVMSGKDGHVKRVGLRLPC